MATDVRLTCNDQAIWRTLYAREERRQQIWQEKLRLSPQTAPVGAEYECGASCHLKRRGTSMYLRWTLCHWETIEKHAPSVRASDSQGRAKVLEGECACNDQMSVQEEHEALWCRGVWAWQHGHGSVSARHRIGRRLWNTLL